MAPVGQTGLLGGPAWGAVQPGGRSQGHQASVTRDQLGPDPGTPAGPWTGGLEPN